MSRTDTSECLSPALRALFSPCVSLLIGSLHLVFGHFSQLLHFSMFGLAPIFFSQYPTENQVLGISFLVFGQELFLNAQ
jgi:hypothetical protein